MGKGIFRFIVVVLIAVTFLFVFCFKVDGEGYKPLTDSEVADYIARVGMPGVYSDLRKLDAIEHAAPRLVFPDLVLVYDKAGKVRVFFSAPINLTLGGYLQVELIPPSWEKPAIKETDWGLIVLFAAGALAVGIGGGYAFGRLTK